MNNGGEEELRRGVNKEEEEEGEAGKSIDYTVISGSPGNKQQFLEDQVLLSVSGWKLLHITVSSADESISKCFLAQMNPLPNWKFPS